MRSIRVKVFTLACSIAILTSVVLTTLAVRQIQVGNERSLQEMSDTLMEDYDAMIRTQVEMAVSLLQASYDASVERNLSDEDTRKDAAALLRKLTYGTEGYFWADTTSGVNVVMRGMADVEGKTRWDALDANGAPYIQEIIGAAVNGTGYADYVFPRPGQTEALPKRSYSQVFAPFGWVIGTGNYIDDIHTILDQKRQTMKEELNHDVLFLIAIGLIILVAGSGFALVLGGRIAKPIQIMTSVIREMGGLKFTGAERLTALRKHRDETGVMAASLEDMSRSLGETVRSINSVTLELSAHAEELSASSAENKQAVGQVATTINEMAEGNEHQAEDASRTNEALQDLNGHVERISQQTADGAQLANATLATVKEGRTLLEKQSRQVEESLVITREADESMSELAGMMHQVEQIIGLIRSISDQTHLLALNAAIEAARAGNHGRGFAVVSHEIRKLAESAAEATDKIGGHIRSTLERTETTAGRIRVAHDYAVEQATGLRDTEGKFNEIFRSADEIVQSSASVSTSLHELQQISQGILERSQNQAAAAQQSAAAMEEISASAEEQAASHENLVTAAAQLATMAEQLTEEMGKFEV
ncbi:cache domain-containing protein [Gorillibacterium sp. CAU 1737]|uniref:methyl-accepting chemotaxis protein n=1 Tax=Gorillibacterium sp. CAU 1737 TaxID=3140362 RepID=UPI0032611A93